MISGRRTPQFGPSPGCPNIVFRAVRVITRSWGSGRGARSRERRSSSRAGREFRGPQTALRSAGGLTFSRELSRIAAYRGVRATTGSCTPIGSGGVLVALLLVAECCAPPNTKYRKFTMADVLSFRLKQRPVRMAQTTSKLTVRCYLMASDASPEGSSRCRLESRDAPVRA